MPGDAHRTHDTDPEVHQNKGWTSQIDPELDPELTEQVGPSPRPILENGAIVDRYVILSHLGSGGMGAVYAAWDQKLARRVALKLLHHDRRRGQDNGWRLQREARALARLDHENVVRVFDVGTWGDAPYITMELIDGPHPRASRGPSPTEWCVASLLKRPHPRASRGPSPTEGALRRSSNALTPALRAAPLPRSGRSGRGARGRRLRRWVFSTVSFPGTIGSCTSSAPRRRPRPRR